MARDRPPPYDEGGRFYTGARGPVPRERWGAQTMARDRPSPYDEGGRFYTGARGPVPRERWGARTIARDRPSPYGKVKVAVILNFC